MNGSDLFPTLWALLMIHLHTVINVAAATCICVILGCRVAKMMRGVTSLAVFLQHAGLALAMFGSVLLTIVGHGEWAATCTSVGVLVFLLMSVKRWRGAAPAGTNRPQPLEHTQLRHAVGGIRGKP